MFRCKTMARWASSLLVAGLLALAPSCGGGGGTVQPSAPVIGTQPLSQTISEGGSASFSVTATGNGALSYQWKKGSTAISGKTATSLPINPVTLADAGTYSVVVTNTLNGATASTTSNSATLTVYPAPVAPGIVSQPTSQTVTETGNVTFSVTATTSDAGTLTYQWKKGITILSGKTASSLTISPVTLADAGSYSVVVTNSLNGLTATTSSAVATLTVNPAGPAPTITTQPQSKTVVVPSGNTFSVVATGTGTLSYQWRKNGTDIVGGNSNSYIVAATDLHETSAQYSVVVTDSNGNSPSENATLTVMAPEPTYAGDPIPTFGGRTLTALPSFQTGTAFPNGSFRFGYDENLKNPAWTAYANFKFISVFSLTGADPFQEDTRLALPQVAHADYTGSGWTRGHNVMQSDIGYRYGQIAADDSCRMSNIAPQIADLNTNFWNKLEQAVGGSNPTSWTPGLADKFGRIWIYTGPTFTSTPATFTSKNIAIPNGFYKIVVYETTPGQPKALAVLAPHQITSTNPPAATALPYADIWKYVTSVARIEQLTGLNFFPTPATTLPTAFKTEVDVIGLGAPFEKTSGPNVHMVEPSWNISVSAGTTVNFVGAASSTTGTISNPTWTFGSEGTATGLTTAHTFNSAGTVTVGFAVTDGASATNTITRVITVTGNTAPTISGIGAQSAVLSNPIDVAFTVNDDSTPKNNLVLTATSSNQTVLPDASIVLFSGPDASTGACILRLTGTGTVGSCTVTVHVTDGNSATTDGTFSFSVTDGNSAPVITGLTTKSTPVDTPITVNFQVSDAETSDAGTLAVTATSSDTTLIPGTLSVANSGGACSVVLTPATGLSGSTTITITVTDGGGKVTAGTFTVVVGTPATPKLIISQYYEGIAGTNRWVEITNVGSDYSSTATPLYLALWANPFNATGGSYNTGLLVPGMAAGTTIVIKNSGATVPGLTYVTGTPVTGDAVTSYNGDDILYITPNATNDAAAYAARIDSIGVNSVSWTGTSTTTAATTLAAGYNCSWVRNATVTVPSATFSTSEWTIIPGASLATMVDTAATGNTNRLGEHVYNH